MTISLPPTVLVSGPTTPNTKASVSVNLTITGATIPVDFIGLSGENQDLINGYFQGTSGNAASYIGLVNLLGANGSLRIGGGSADTASPPALTNGIATNLATFVAALGAGWKVVYGLNAKSNNSATAATHAGYIATALGASNVVFHYGNEPVTSGNFTTATYTTMWNTYHTAVTAAVPGALVAAPDDGLIAGTGNLSEVSGLSVGVAGLTFVSLHAYEYGAPTVLTNAEVPLSSWRSLNKRSLQALNSWAGVTKMRVTESNMISNKGQAGMTDRLMHTAYTALKIGDLAKMGWAGCNLHNFYGTPVANYNTLVQNGDGSFSPGASFYALYLFSKLLGQTIVNSAVDGNVSVIATQRAAGKSNMLITNIDPTNSVDVTVSQTSAWSTATVLAARSGTGLGSTDSVITLGGQAIGAGGSWSGAPFSINNGETFRLGPCEVALVQVQ